MFDTDCPNDAFHTEEECNNVRNLNQQERDAVQFVINHTRLDFGCDEIAIDLQAKLDNNQIKAYTATTMRAYGDMHTLSGEIHLFEPMGRGASELGWTTLHEGAHFHGYSSEYSAENMANYCWLGD